MSVTTAHGGQSNNATITVTVPITVAIQVPDAFVSMAGNGLVLLGGPGGLTTTAITANGNPAGGTVVWTPGPRLQVNGINSLNASVSGTAASTSAGDTYVSVQYTVNGQSATATFLFTVLDPTIFRPSTFGGSQNTVPYQSGDNYGYQTTVSYYLYDQSGTQISLPGITNSELLTTTSNPYGVIFDPPDNQARAGGAGNDITGRMPDYLTVVAPAPGLPPGFTASRIQSWTVNGYSFAPTQEQDYSSTYATVTTQTFSRQ